MDYWFCADVKIRNQFSVSHSLYPSQQLQICSIHPSSSLNESYDRLLWPSLTSKALLSSDKKDWGEKITFLLDPTNPETNRIKSFRYEVPVFDATCDISAQTHLRVGLHAVFKKKSEAFLNKLELHTFKFVETEEWEFIRLRINLVFPHQALRVRETKQCV